MEKFSKAEKDFVEAVKDKVEEVKEQPPIREAVRTLKLITKPSKIPNALIAYGLTKESSATISEDIPVLELRDLLFASYGHEWLDWSPETIALTFFNGDRNDVVENKILAMATCYKTDTPWTEWHIFENVGKAFNHQVPDFDYVQPLSLGECAVTMKIMEELREDEEFSSEVLTYVAMVARTENYVYLPSELLVGKAQPYLERYLFDHDLKRAVGDHWTRVGSRKDLLDQTIDEANPLHVQIGKLAILKQYLEENVNG